VSIAVGVKDNVGHVEEAGSSESCFETTLDSCLTGRSLSLIVEGDLDLITGRGGAGTRSVTRSTRLLAARHHVSTISSAPTRVSPGTTSRFVVNAGGFGRSRVTLVARFLTVGQHVSRVVFALTLGGPGSTVVITIDASTSDRFNGDSCESC